MKATTKTKLALASSLILVLFGLALGLALMGLSETASHVDPSPVADVRQEEKDSFPVVDWDYWQDRTIKLEEELRAAYQALDDVPFVRPTEMLTLVEAEDVLKRLARWCRDNIGLLEKGVKFMKWTRG